MVDTQSLAGTFHINEVDNQFNTLEEAFKEFFQWSRNNSNDSVFLREWRNLRLSQFLGEGITSLDALERLYEKSVLLCVFKIINEQR